LTHHASPDFWACYRALPSAVRQVADSAFALLKDNPEHPSLHFKQVGSYWSARAGIHHRVLGVEVSDGVLWFWIGSHSEYYRLVR